MSQHKIDWDKVRTLNDIKAIQRMVVDGLNMTFTETLVEEMDVAHLCEPVREPDPPEKKWWQF